MNSHKNARHTFARRLEMVKSMIEAKQTPAAAAAVAGVSPVTAYKWLGRYLAARGSGIGRRLLPAPA